MSKNDNLSTRLNRKAELWGKVETTNELGELDYVDRKIKNLHVAIIPQTGNMQKGQADTVLTNVTTKFICRYQRGIKSDMWLIYGGKRYDIKYPQDPYAEHKILEIFCEEVAK